MKQMFDISEKLVSEQADAICGVKTKNWEDSSWKYLSLVGDEQVISLQRTKSPRLFRFCIVSGKGSSTSRIQRSLEEQGCRNPIRQKLTEIMMLSMESRLNSKGTSSQDSQRCSSVIKSMIY